MEYDTIPLQLKLTVGPAGDQYEQEADRVAEQVVSMNAPAPVENSTPGSPQVSRAPIADSITPLQRSADLQASAATGGEVTPQTESTIRSAQGGGKSLSSDEKSYFEPRFGADFSGVKIHTGGQANDLAKSINARAFTVGSDIFFGSGEYNSDSTDGKKLMAHGTEAVARLAEGSRSAVDAYRTARGKWPDSRELNTKRQGQSCKKDCRLGG